MKLVAEYCFTTTRHPIFCENDRLTPPSDTPADNCEKPDYPHPPFLSPPTTDLPNIQINRDEKYIFSIILELLLIELCICNQEILLCTTANVTDVTKFPITNTLELTDHLLDIAGI